MEKGGGEKKGKGKGRTVDPCFSVRVCFVRSEGNRLIRSFFLQVVDTVLVKLYAQFEKTDELYALLQEPNYVFLQEVEDILVATQQFSALRILYKQKGEDLKLLDLYAQ